MKKRTCRVLTSQLLIVSLLFSSCSIALAEQSRRGILVGSWKAVTIYDKGPYAEDRETGRLEIKVSNDCISGVSTTGAVMKGFYDDEKQLLKMRYRRDHANGKVWLRLSQDGKSLEGEWSNHSGESGRFLLTKE